MRPEGNISDRGFGGAAQGALLDSTRRGQHYLSSGKLRRNTLWVAMPATQSQY